MADVGPAPRNGDDRRPGQPPVLQPGSQVGCPNRLDHGHAGAAGSAGIPIGHVGRCLFRVAEHPPDAQFLHLHQGESRYRWHEEHRADTVALEGFSHESPAGHLGHDYLFPEKDIDILS